MKLAFSPQIANYNDRRYDVIRTLKELGVSAAIGPWTSTDVTPDANALHGARAV